MNDCKATCDNRNAESCSQCSIVISFALLCLWEVNHFIGCMIYQCLVGASQFLMDIQYLVKCVRVYWFALRLGCPSAIKVPLKETSNTGCYQSQNHNDKLYINKCMYNLDVSYIPCQNKRVESYINWIMHVLNLQDFGNQHIKNWWTLFIGLLSNQAQSKVWDEII